MSAATRSQRAEIASGTWSCRAVGALGALGGATAWASAVASTGAARAAELALVEAGAPPGGDPWQVDSVGTVDLALHDTRLGALVVVLLALVLLVAPAGRAASGPRWPVVLGGGAALVLGNVLVAPSVGEGAGGVLAGTAGLLAVVVVGCAVAAGLAAALPGARPSRAGRDPLTLRGRLVGAGAAAGTAVALGVNGLEVDGLGDGWGYLLVPAAAASAALSAAVLGVLTVTFVLLGPTPRPGRRRLALAAAAATPGTASAAVLLGGGPLEELVGLLAGPILFAALPGGLVSLVLTAPAGAEIGVDGLPFVGGGTLVGLVVGLVLSSLGSSGGERVPAPAVGTGPDDAADLA
ncbi:hypothetical protein [uncultured Pseudokineococcus sp.]|uniref:hypothetical protein n=1 Tax=uncultured Pseudokineococcus sp. TaxID=1642928 RepID=UPI00260CC167|nr:hypothetical protein [uncultured Pseudokineococcus sp.]